jgi:glycosyltransferase involved in cell wall biosynthesis
MTQLGLFPYYARKLSLDVVNFLGTTGAFGLPCATVQHVKTLHHIQYPQTLDSRCALFRKLLVGPSARAADVVISNSSVVTESLAGLGIAGQRVVTIPEAVDHNVFFPRQHEDRHPDTLRKYGVRQPYILFVSSLWPHKNAHGLVEAFALLVKKGFRSHSLVIVGGLSGSSYEKEVRESVSKHGLDQFVQFTGHVKDRGEVRDFYVGADVFVYPSYYETFGLTLLESMACGTPVVGANKGSIPEVCGGAAILTDPDDYDAMSEAILKLTRDAVVRAECVARGLSWAKEFSWERTASETMRAYDLACSLRRKELQKAV